jgi:hypothetical protein
MSALRELAIPESVRHLDGDAVIDALARHNGNVSAAAKDLGVPSADFRAFLRPNPQYQAAAHELIEHRQDLADATILEALKHPDLRYRLPAAMYQSRYSTVAAARGWITNAPVDTAAVAEPKNITIRWANPDGSIAPPPPTEQVMRDGKMIELRVYDRAEPQSLDGTVNALTSASDNVLPNDIVPDDTDFGHEHIDNVHELRPLVGVDRDRVETALRQRPGDRDVILSTVEANGFDISGL